MKRRVLSFVYRHLYMVWGAVVVAVVTSLTGAALTATILGTTLGLTCVALAEQLFR